MKAVGDFAAGYLDATVARQAFVVFNQLVELGPIPLIGEAVDRIGMLAVPAVSGIAGTAYALMGQSQPMLLPGSYSTRSKVMMAVGSTGAGVLQAPIKEILPPIVGFDLIEPISVGAGLGVGYGLSTL